VKQVIMQTAKLTDQYVQEGRSPAKGFRSFRVQNLSTPNHLCCSGIELYGVLSSCVSLDLMFGDVLMPDAASLAQCGVQESNTPLELTAAVTDRVFKFESVTPERFDTKGVLYAFGTNFGKEEYKSPETRGVQVKFSSDANNFYSRSTGHRVGDAKAAVSVILGHAHPGDSATMWSKGAAKAWFQIDLPEEYTLELTHYCYRGDYGGGQNHPRTWALEASRDGSTWETLRSHENDTMVNMHQAGSWSISG